MTIAFIIGTRPEAIKLAPVVLEAKKNNLNYIVISTGQHQTMLNETLKVFNIKPDYNLKVMVKNQSLSTLSSKLFKCLQKIVDDLSIEAFMVQGDTTSAMIASIIAFYNKLKIYHVEAGLRTNNIHDPFPEEFNRKIISLIASTNFCPTIANKKNLYDEGIKKNIYITGNTVIDSLYLIERKIKSSEFYKKKIITKLEKLVFKNFYSKKYILITGHRRENFGNGFVNIFNTFDKVAKNNKDINFIFPVHLNPNVRNIALSTLKDNNNFFLIPPLSYELMIFLMMNAIFIVTDSGGIQEEGPALGKFIIVTRKNTERPEALATKHVKLVGTNKNLLESQLNKAINTFEELKKLPRSIIYGNGKASKKIISVIIKENNF